METLKFRKSRTLKPTHPLSRGDKELQLGTCSSWLCPLKAEPHTARITGDGPNCAWPHEPSHSPMAVRAGALVLHGASPQ